MYFFVENKKVNYKTHKGPVIFMSCYVILVIKFYKMFFITVSFTEATHKNIKHCFGQLHSLPINLEKHVL